MRSYPVAKIRIVIGRDGTPSIEVLDGRGDACLDLTRELEQRLGTPTGERELKPEIDATEAELETESEEEHGS